MLSFTEITRGLGIHKTLLVDGSGNGYVRTIGYYVHLNPIRAKLLGSEQRLREYPWSSYGWYLAANAYGPEWLRVDPLLGEHGIAADTETKHTSSDDCLTHHWGQVQVAQTKEGLLVKRVDVATYVSLPLSVLGHQGCERLLKLLALPM